jgi:SAM-dependent methyltransferase
MSPPESQWAVALFNRSVLKQAKYRRLLDLIDDPRGRANLDIGADNGVISFLLRRLGGTWCSADLDAHTVASIRRLVHTDVYQLNSGSTPFADASFDQVIIVDFLEHISDDRGFVEELARIVKPAGVLVVNVPHLKPRSLLNRFRHRIGLTDEWHGHLRPGYSLSGLTTLLEPFFVVERAVTYSRTFSELVDTALNWGYHTVRQGKNGSGESRKGPVVTGSDIEKHRKQFRVLSALYPVLWATVKLDGVLPLQQGYKLIVRARRTDQRNAQVSSASGKAPERAAR